VEGYISDDIGGGAAKWGRTALLLKAIFPEIDRVIRVG
jgi:hypothetical protein